MLEEAEKKRMALLEESEKRRQALQKMQQKNKLGGKLTKVGYLVDVVWKLRRIQLFLGWTRSEI